jgi:hypothetical protein
LIHCSGGAAFVVEPHYRPARQGQVGHNETHPWEQLSGVMLHLRPHSAGGLPARGLVEESLVLDQGLLTRSSHRARQQFGNVPLQALVGWDANCIFHAPLLQRLIDLGPGKGRITPEGNRLPHLLLPCDLRQQELFPALGAVHVAGPQLGRQTITLLLEQQQRVITARLEVPRFDNRIWSNIRTSFRVFATLCAQHMTPAGVREMNSLFAGN